MGRAKPGPDLMQTLVKEISQAMTRGASFAQIEAEVIDPARLDEDRKSALWMYAWSFQSPARQRREALEHILMLTDAERQTPGRLI